MHEFRHSATINIKVDAENPLPVTIYTLLSSTIASILVASGHSTDDSPIWFICRKTYHVRSFYLQERESPVHISSEGARFTLFCGRLAASGSNITGQCSPYTRQAWAPVPVWIRLPPVQVVVSGHGSVWAMTEAGTMYGWGTNVGSRTSAGKLGIGSDDWIVAEPRRVIGLESAGQVQELLPMADRTFVRGSAGWFVSGGSGEGQFTYMPHCDIVTAWYSSLSASFAWTPSGLHAMGQGWSGELGVGPGVGGATLATLTPVALPPGTEVESVVSHGRTTYFICEDATVYAAGWNGHGQMCLSNEERMVPTPVVLPFTARYISPKADSVVFIDEVDDVWYYGTDRHLGLTDEPWVGSPVRLPLPGAVVTVVHGHSSLFVQTAGPDAGWFACGDNSQCELGIGTRDAAIQDWRRVALADVTMVWTQPGCSFFLTPTGVFVAGVNADERMGPSPRRTVPTPMLLEVPVSLELLRAFVECARTDSLRVSRSD